MNQGPGRNSADGVASSARSTGAVGMPGVLCLLVGPSGVGKDTVIDALRSAQVAGRDFYFPKRIITRDTQVGEAAHSMTAAAFHEAEARGEFFLSWTAHGLRYALPMSILPALSAGQVVVTNISRRMLHDPRLLPGGHGARANDEFGQIAPWRVLVVELTAPREVLAQRLAGRGRETADQIADRLARDVPVQLPADTPAMCHVQVSNAGDVTLARDAILAAIGQEAEPVAQA